jgi:hypothetical protein
VVYAFWRRKEERRRKREKEKEEEKERCACLRGREGEKKEKRKREGEWDMCQCVSGWEKIVLSSLSQPDANTWQGGLYFYLNAPTYVNYTKTPFYNISIILELIFDPTFI